MSERDLERDFEQCHLLVLVVHPLSLLAGRWSLVWSLKVGVLKVEFDRPG